MTTAITQIDPKNANVLVPTQHLQQVSPWHAARTSVVQINPDPMAGDVFKVGSRYNEAKKSYEDLFSPAKPALMRIAAAAGIVWNWRESGPQVLQKDYVVYKAVGALRLPDGSWQPIVATKEIDLTVIEEETYEANLKKALEYASDPKKQAALKGMTPEQWAQAQTRANMIQWRKNKLMRAETGAMLRVIRAALGMKSQYTREELQKPFIVPRIDFAPDYSDPEVRQAIIQNGIPAMAQLFGQAQAAVMPTGRSPFEASHPALAAPAEPEEEVFVEYESSVEEELPADGFPAEDDLEPSNPTLFDNPALSNPPAQNRGQGKQQVVTYCANCGAEITSAKVVEYSQKKFGKPLCYKCQNGGAQ